MQVATLFRESAKLLGASLDGSTMENAKYCMKSETPADDGYETCVDSLCTNNVERMMGGPQHNLEQGTLRHSAMDEHGQHRQSMTAMRMESYGDPYSFVDEMPNSCLPSHINSNNHNHPSQPKKRGRRKKPDNPPEPEYGMGKRNGSDDLMDSRERKRHDRFNGLSEEEVSQRSLPDHLCHNLDIVIVGINPGLFAAYKGHHYAGPGNHFWKCLYLSGLVPEPLTAEDDYKLMRYGIGFTNMVARPTKGSADLTRREIKQGSQVLLEKLQKFQPRVAVFNGKLIYEVFSGKKDFPFGRQSDFVEGTNTYIWVMPSSSARCAQLPRAADKVPFYMALKKFRDYLHGLISELDDTEVVFPESKTPAKVTNDLFKKGSETPSPMGDESTPSFMEVPVKKKRGRPRKGMEKHPPGASKAKKNLAAASGGASGRGEKNRNSSTSIQNDEPPRKRRGRPKKARTDDLSSNHRTMSNNTPEGLESGSANSLGTCPAQSASTGSSGSVSGYSTGTNMSSEDRRRDENGSLSNAGSGGPSPSHHSFTTQSDLSSEISAAISCGSAPPSPLPNQTESVFDPLSNVPHSREDGQGGQSNNGKHPMSNIHGSPHLSLANCPPGPGSLYGAGAGRNNSLDSQDPSYLAYHSYDSRLHNFSNRPPSYQPSNSRDGSSNVSMQVNSSYHGPYETSKPTDVATKSLSGLESLVDQIPSIADSEMGGPSVSGANLSGLVPDSIVHSQGMGLPGLPSVTSSMSHGGNPYSGDPPSGFLPYSHASPSTYASASHYASSPYYSSELSPSFAVNSLGGPTYCSPSPSSGIMFGYPGYHAQYGAPPGPSSYSHSPPAGLHLSPAYGAPPGYPTSYAGPNPYSHPHSMTPGPNSASSAQRFPQRLHLRQEGMDLGHMGFGGF